MNKRPGVSLAFVAAICTSIASGFAIADVIDPLDGNTLNAWVTESHQRFVDKLNSSSDPIWSVHEGVLHCSGIGGGQFRYDRELGDFCLSLEYRHGPGANSGVSFHAPPYDGRGGNRPSVQGFEIQILDDAGKPASKRSTGALYRYVAPATSAARPAGQWNRLEVTCQGSRIRVELNGAVVHDLDRDTIPEIADKPRRGYLFLQNHGHPIDFRHIQIELLDKLQ